MSVKSVKSPIDIHISTHQVATNIYRDLSWTFNGMGFYITEATAIVNIRGTFIHNVKPVANIAAINIGNADFNIDGLVATNNVHGVIYISNANRATTHAVTGSLFAENVGLIISYNPLFKNSSLVLTNNTFEHHSYKNA